MTKPNSAVSKSNVAVASFILIIIFAIAKLTAGDVGYESNKVPPTQPNYIPTKVMPQLKWHLQGDAPLVTIENTLPSNLLSKVVSEIQSSKGYPKQLQCSLSRDGQSCGKDRWINFTLEDAKRYINNQVDQEERIERDVFEQAALQIAKYDLMHILPPYMSKHIVGFSWRILINISGDDSGVAHYDSDEATDYALEDVPMINPLLSTVTYLTDNGEPTLILEQAQIIRNSPQPYSPRNAYVSMPKANKHIAFDPRLFHGANNPISSNRGEVRIAIGMNFHTERSLESYDFALRPSKILKPMDDIIINNNTREKLDPEPVIKPWKAEDTMDMEAMSREKWAEFPVLTPDSGLDYQVSNPYLPVQLSLRLPVSMILYYNQHKDPGCTLGIKLKEGDFTITHLKEVSMEPIVKKGNPDKNAIDLANKMLAKRCEIFEHDQLLMIPALNYDRCNESRVEL